MSSSQQPLTQGGRLAFGDSDDDDDLFNEEMCQLLGSTVATLARSGGDGAAAPDGQPGRPMPLQQQEQQQQNGLKWNAAGSLARAAQQGRLQPSSDLQTRSMPSTSQYPPAANRQHQQHQHQQHHRHQQHHQQHNVSGGHSFQSYHHSNSFPSFPPPTNAQQQFYPHQNNLPPQSAQMSELQRQVDHYKQQLMFAQQELNEVKRAGLTRGGQTGTVAERPRARVLDGGGDGVERARESPSRNERRQQGTNVDNRNKHENTPRSVSVSTYNTTKEQTVMSIVPRVLTLGSSPGVHFNADAHHGRHHGRHQQQVPLLYRLDRLEKDIAAMKQYRIKRSELYSIVDEHHDVPGSVLVNLEAVLSPFSSLSSSLSGVSFGGDGLRKPFKSNVKDISVMLMSVVAYVLGTDAEMVLGKMAGEERERERGGGGAKGAHHVLSEYNTNATSNSGTMVGVFPTEVMCTTNATMAAGAGGDGWSGSGSGPGALPSSLSSRDDSQRCVAAFVKFVGSLFTILNEFAADTGLLASMIDELAGDEGGRGGRATRAGRASRGGQGSSASKHTDGDGSSDADVAGPSRKTMARNIVRTMEVLARVAPGGATASTGATGSAAANTRYAMDAVARFVHVLARLRSEGDRAILMPVLKSKELQRVLLAYPGASRDDLLKFVMVMLEDKHTFAEMELDAAKELGVTPSRRAVGTSNQLKTPSRMGGGISGITRPRRHSMINKRLGLDTDARPGEDESSLPGDPLWASRLTQTINLCMADKKVSATAATASSSSPPSLSPSLSPTSSPSSSPWTTQRLCMAFFASLVERLSEALLQSVVDFKHLENFGDGRETLMHHLVCIAGVAAGEGSLLHPTSCSDTDVAAQRVFLQNRRIVHESLVLLRALLTRIPGAVRTLALEDSNVALCMLEKVSRFGTASVDEPALSDGRLALWVGALDAAHGRTSSSLEIVARGLKVLLLKELS